MIGRLGARRLRRVANGARITLRERLVESGDGLVDETLGGLSTLDIADA